MILVYIKALSLSFLLNYYLVSLYTDVDDHAQSQSFLL